MNINEFIKDNLIKVTGDLIKKDPENLALKTAIEEFHVKITSIPQRSKAEMLSDKGLIEIKLMKEALLEFLTNPSLPDSVKSEIEIEKTVLKDI